MALYQVLKILNTFTRVPHELKSADLDIDSAIDGDALESR